MSFPDGFIWGVATSSYQIEGSPRLDGGGASVWDMLCRRPGKVFEGDTGDVACDHFHRYQDDVALMQSLGVQAYRMSISWPRVQPAGTGPVSEAGLGFYDKLVDTLLAASVTPYVTLFHWDYPYDLYCKGGWLNPDSSDWFADYTRILMDKLSDRVQHWMTLNEPQCFISLGHEIGIHAPGDQLGQTEILRATHNALLAHGKAVQTIRAHAKAKPQIGFAPVGITCIPATGSPEDIEAARSKMFSCADGLAWSNNWWLGPIFEGAYPEDGLAVAGANAPEIKPGDMETIRQALDFFGVNIYHGEVVKAGEHGPVTVPHPVGGPRTMFYWQVTPEALYWGPRFFADRYNLPIYITENGIAVTDWVALDGKVHDPQRIDYLHRHLSALRRASSDGVDVRGYFQWSFMDNFEWAEGYKLRFGIVYVDNQTQQRISKDSAYWYQTVIQSNGALLESSEA